MNIEINNIGKIEYADIALDGITIIAGENNIGKSTIGKAVFSVFRGLSNWQRMYDETCAMNLNRVMTKCSQSLENFCLKNTEAIRRRTNRINQLIDSFSHSKDIIANIEDYKYFRTDNRQRDTIQAHADLTIQLRMFCESFVKIYQGDSQSLMGENETFFDEWISGTAYELEHHVEIDEKVLQAGMIQKSFGDYFKMQYLREDSGGAHIRIKNKDKISDIFLEKTGCNISEPINFDANIYFIETPKLFDKIGSYRNTAADAKEELRKIMVPNIFLNTKRLSQVSLSDDTIENIIEVTPKELDEILDMLRGEMGGYAYFYEKSGIKFKDNSLKNPVEAQNVSTGLKAMAFLEYALRIGAIQKGDVLILDEPEINLHPEWQISYARALVLLHKKYNLTFLVTSHSPYFIRALECLSDKYDVMNHLNVYLMDKDTDGKQQIDNVMESEYGMTELYDRLSAPLDDLQDEIDRKYD